jgi:hypothetical protein
MSIITDLNPQALAVKTLIYVGAAGALFFGGYYLGYKHEKTAYDLYVTQQKVAAEAQEISNQNALAALAASDAAAVQTIKAQHNETVKQIEASRDAALSNLASSDQRLRAYLAGTGQQRPKLPHSAASAKGSAGAAPGGLFDGVSNLDWYLTYRFSDADSNTAALNEAVALLAEDRKICNGSLPGVSKQ